MTFPARDTDATEASGLALGAKVEVEFGWTGATAAACSGRRSLTSAGCAVATSIAAHRTRSKNDSSEQAGKRVMAGESPARHATTQPFCA